METYAKSLHFLICDGLGWGTKISNKWTYTLLFCLYYAAMNQLLAPDYDTSGITNHSPPPEHTRFRKVFPWEH
jgi:hypothetical protein